MKTDNMNLFSRAESFSQIEFCKTCPQKSCMTYKKHGFCCVLCPSSCVGKMVCPLLDNSQNSGKSSTLSAMQQVRQRNKIARDKRIGVNSLFNENKETT